MYFNTTTHTHSLVKKQAMEIQQPNASTWEAVTIEFGTTITKTTTTNTQVGGCKGAKINISRTSVLKSHKLV